MSHTKKTPILWLILNKKVQFFEPYLKKSSILWVMFLFEKINWTFFLKKMMQRVVFFQKIWFEGWNLLENMTHRILWVTILWKEFNFWLFFNQKNSIFWVTFKKKGSILWVYSKKRSTLWKVCKIFESYWKKGSVLWVVFFELYWWEKFNCLNRFYKVPFFQSI